MLVYATSADYVTWTGGSAPANIAQVLRKASLQVREATKLDFYAADTTGLPTLPAQLQAFNDATCCQAAALVELSINPNAGGAVETSVKEAKSLGSARIQYAQTDAQNAADAKKRASEGLVTDAIQILRIAGLARNAAWVTG
jgi:hypothetical protein